MSLEHMSLESSTDRRRSLRLSYNDPLSPVGKRTEQSHSTLRASPDTSSAISQMMSSAAASAPTTTSTSTSCRSPSILVTIHGIRTDTVIWVLVSVVMVPRSSSSCRIGVGGLAGGVRFLSLLWLKLIADRTRHTGEISAFHPEAGTRRSSVTHRRFRRSCPPREHIREALL